MNDESITWPLSGIEHPLENDVVYGRGGLANNHNGNKRFRAIVQEFKNQYLKCSRHEKTLLAETLVRQWRSQTPPGRFLKLNDMSGLWDDVGKKARSKCSQLLREGAPKMRKGGAAEAEEDNEEEEEQNCSSEDDVPPPPPPLASPSTSTDTLNTTPPQKNSSNKKDFQASSPSSVMDMPFYSVENVVAQPDMGAETESVIAQMFHSIKIPRMSSCRRQTAACTNSNGSQKTPSSDAAKPAAKAASPLGSFLQNMLKERGAAWGSSDKPIPIFQDNASPIRGPTSKPSPVTKTTEKFLETISCPLLDVESNHSSNTTTSTRPVEFLLTAADMNESIALPHCEIPRPRKILSTKRGTSWDNKSLDSMAMEIWLKGGSSEHSVSWKSVDMDLDDDPILAKYAKTCTLRESSSSHHHRSRLSSVDSSGNRSRVSSISVDSCSSSYKNALLNEDLGSLHLMFRDRCSSTDTGTCSAASALVIFEREMCINTNTAESNNDKDNSNKEEEEVEGDQQPELDDMSLASYGTFCEDNDDNSMDGSSKTNGLDDDGGTRHTAVSIDSSTLDALMNWV